MMNWTENEARYIAKVKREFAESLHSRMSADEAGKIMVSVSRRPTGTERRLLMTLPLKYWKLPQNVLWSKLWNTELERRLARFSTNEDCKETGRVCLEFFDILFAHAAVMDRKPHLAEYFPGYPLKEAAQAGNVEMIKVLLDVSTHREKKLQTIYHILLNHEDFNNTLELNDLCGGLDAVNFKLLYPLWVGMSEEKVNPAFDRFMFRTHKAMNCWKQLIDFATIDLRITTALEEGVSIDVPFMEMTDLTLRRLLYFLYELKDELREWLCVPYRPSYSKHSMYPKLESLLNATEKLIDFERDKTNGAILNRKGTDRAFRTETTSCESMSE